MTTRDKGITYPIISSFVDTGSALGVRVTNIANDFTVKQAWTYGAGNIFPVNASPLSAVSPTDLVVSGQNALLASGLSGGNLIFKAGVKDGAGLDGNIQFCNTSGIGAGWNTSHLILGSNFHFWIDAKNRLRTKTVAPTADLDGNVVGIDLIGSTVYDPPNLVDGAGVVTTVACAAAALGDMAICSFSLDQQGLILSAYVSSANVVSVRFQNETGGAIDLASGTLSVKVIKL